MLIFDNQLDDTPESICSELYYAMECNSHEKGWFSKNNIKEVVACVCGEHDGRTWHWLVKHDNDKFYYISGGCDYTGWDCQSYLVFVEVESDKLQLAFEETDNYNRPIRQWFTEALLDMVVENEVLKDGEEG